MNVGPQDPYSDELHRQKYRLPGETFRDAMGRVASALKDDDAHYHAFRDALLGMRFMPAGRIQAAMGAPKSVTPYNCLSGDTEIITSEGFQRLDKIVGQNVRVLSPVSGQFELAQAKSYGRQMLRRVEVSNSIGGQTRTGSFNVMATANHRWVLQDGSVTEDLQVGDILRAGDCDVETDATSFAHGLVYGDGTKIREGHYQLRLCGDKARHLPTVLKGFGDQARVSYPQSYLGDPHIHIECDAQLKEVPSYDYPQTVRGFVQGLLAADGCFVTRGNDPFQFHGSEAIVLWMRDRLVYAGYAPCGKVHEAMAGPTNYGERSYPIWVQTFRPTSEHKGFRVKAISEEHEGIVYCVEEPKHRQIVLRNGLRTGQCYVSGTIPDSFVGRDNPEGSSIMDRAREAAATMRMGGGIGYDFSTLRPRRAMIEKLQSESSGPLGFMPIFNEICKATSSSGNRRGAQMGVLRIDHPDAWDFMHAKHSPGVLTGFNMSLAVTDKFMEAKYAGKPFDQVFGGRTVRTVDPGELWEALMRSTWDWAEPGVLFIDTINRMNNLWYCEEIAATNPCGEQPLPPFGACLLGSFNLVQYLVPQPSGLYSFDWDRLRRDVEPCVRALDNVVDRAAYPLPEQEFEAKAKRRMGIGVTGLANCAEAMGHAYGTPAFVEFEERVLHFINRHCYLAGVVLAVEKGPFPLWDAERYSAGEFVKTLDDDVRELISVYGVRNSHYTSIAPTGTISMAADNVSSSVEPVYRWRQERTVIMAEGPRQVALYDHGFGVLGVRGRRTSVGEVTAKQHVDVLRTAQRFVDSAVSKTVNCDGSMPWADFQAIYDDAYTGGAKGCTTYNASGKRAGLFKEDFEPADLPFPTSTAPISTGVVEGLSCEWDPATGRRSCE